MKTTSIVWFRQDLRLSDNPTIAAASALGPILPIYILDDGTPKAFKMGSCTKLWLHHSLDRLNKSLEGTLNYYQGEALEIIDQLKQLYPNLTHIFWNKAYESWALQQEKQVIDLCQKKEIEWHAYNGNYLWSPQKVMKEDQTYYKVFTAYKNKALSIPPRVVTQPPKKPKFLKDSLNKTELGDFHFIPTHGWYKTIESTWDMGEQGAQKKLSLFIKNGLRGYKDGRNFPSEHHTSRLSPHLHFGEISPSQILQSISHLEHLGVCANDRDTFLNELIWRDFSCYLLFHFQALPTDNFNKNFNGLSWTEDPTYLKAWQKGQTGFPFVDAGLRELWQTGTMHNRVRMVAASFLVKNLNVHWHQGRDWFWDCLLDADLASNSMNWQWIAGTGIDAAPYFRIFNPISQGEKFDKLGLYTRKFIPELNNLPDQYLFKPWSAPEPILKSAGVTLGKTYPYPIIDLEISRKNALSRFKALKSELPKG